MRLSSLERIDQSDGTLHINPAHADTRSDTRSDPRRDPTGTSETRAAGLTYMTKLRDHRYPGRGISHLSDPSPSPYQRNEEKRGKEQKQQSRLGFKAQRPAPKLYRRRGGQEGRIIRCSPPPPSPPPCPWQRGHRIGREAAQRAGPVARSCDYNETEYSACVNDPPPLFCPALPPKGRAGGPQSRPCSAFPSF